VQDEDAETLIYITKKRTSEIVIIYDGGLDCDPGWGHRKFEAFAFIYFSKVQIFASDFYRSMDDE
jgi:hypothetical protein